jgi:hypothetical protein
VRRGEARGALAAVGAAVLVVAAATAIAGSTSQPDPPAELVERGPYAAGWQAAVSYQATPQPGGPPTDDLTRASCRWRIDGTTPPERRAYRNVFLAGCDDAVARTHLEGKR